MRNFNLNDPISQIEIEFRFLEKDKYRIKFYSLYRDDDYNFRGKVEHQKACSHKPKPNQCHTYHTFLLVTYVKFM